MGSILGALGPRSESREADPDPRSHPLTTRAILAAALRTYRERFVRVAGTALVVFGIVGAIDAIAVVLVVDEHVDKPYGAALTSAAAGVLGMAGVVVYAGLLDKVVGAHIHGHPDLSLGEVWRALPLRRLLVADVVFAVAVLAGTALFVVPGILAFTLWALVGPVITIEDLPVRAAFGRSWRLVRRHFWFTFFLVTVPVQFEQWALHVIHYAEIFEHPVVPAFLLNGLLGAVIGSVVGLVEVVLAYELIADDAGVPDELAV